MTSILAPPVAAPAPAPPSRRLPGLLAGALAVSALPLEAALANAVAALPWLRGVDIPDAAVVLVGGAVASTVPAAVVARLWRRPAGVSFAASAALLVVVVAVGVSHSPSALGAAVTAGPTRLLTETLPVTGGRALLLAPLLAVWLAGTAASELLCRTRRSAPALAAPILAYLAAYAATSGAPGADDATGPLLLAALALLALTRRWQADASRGPAAGARPSAAAGERPRRAARRAAVGALAACAVTIGLAVAAPDLPGLGGSPASLQRVPPVTSALLVDPVDAVAALRDDDPSAPARTLLTLTTDAATPGYVPIAYLDRYDGAAWSFDATFTPTGGRVAPAPTGTLGADQSLDTTTVTARVTIVHPYGIPLVPTVGRPTDIRGPAVDVDPSAGMATPVGQLAAGATYRLSSRDPESTVAGLPSSDGLDQGGIGSAQDLAVPAGTAPDLTAGLRYLASITDRSPQPTLSFLQAAASALEQRDRRVNPASSSRSSSPTASRGGTSLAEVITSVVVNHRATPEQFATFFALMARELGVPARLATGFRVATTPDAGPVPAGTYLLTNRDAWTWAEIPVAGVGWVVVDPTPTLTAKEEALPPSSAAASSPTTVAPRQATAVPANVAGGIHGLAPPARIATSDAGLSDLADAGLAALAALVALLVLGPGLAAARRAARRRARRSRDPAEAAAGAWLELLDALEVAGLRPDPSWTPPEVSAAATQVFGAEVGGPIAGVGALAERAVCCLRDPDGPSAEQAWADQRATGQRALATLDRRQRLRALVAVGHQPLRAGGGRRSSLGRRAG